MAFKETTKQNYSESEIKAMIKKAGEYRENKKIKEAEKIEKKKARIEKTKVDKNSAVPVAETSRKAVPAAEIPSEARPVMETPSEVMPTIDTSPETMPVREMPVEAMPREIPTQKRISRNEGRDIINRYLEAHPQKIN